MKIDTLEFSCFYDRLALANEIFHDAEADEEDLAMAKSDVDIVAKWMKKHLASNPQ